MDSVLTLLTIAGTACALILLTGSIWGAVATLSSRFRTVDDAATGGEQPE